MRNFSPVLKKVLTRDFWARHQWRTQKSRVSTFFNRGAERSKVRQSIRLPLYLCALRFLAVVKPRFWRLPIRAMSPAAPLGSLENLDFKSGFSRLPKGAAGDMARMGSLQNRGCLRYAPQPEKSCKRDSPNSLSTIQHAKIAEIDKWRIFSRTNASYASVDTTCMSRRTTCMSMNVANTFTTAGCMSMNAACSGRAPPPPSRILPVPPRQKLLSQARVANQEGGLR